MRCLATVLACTLAGTAAIAQDLPELRARGTLRVVGVEFEQPEMFSFKSEGEPGLEREMLESFARIQRLKIEAFSVTVPDERITALLSGKADVAFGMIVTEERRRRIDFTAEVIKARHVAVSHKPRPFVSSAADLGAFRFGLVKGTSWAQVAAAAGVLASNTEFFDDLETLLVALRDGKVAATVVSVNDATLATKRYPGLQIGMTVGADSASAWGLRKESVALRTALDQHLDHTRKSGGWSRLVVKYFGDQALKVLTRREGQ